MYIVNKYYIEVLKSLKLQRSWKAISYLSVIHICFVYDYTLWWITVDFAALCLLPLRCESARLLFLWLGCQLSVSDVRRRKAERRTCACIRYGLEVWVHSLAADRPGGFICVSSGVHSNTACTFCNWGWGGGERGWIWDSGGKPLWTLAETERRGTFFQVFQ